MRYVGIDPGKAGGIALLDHRGAALEVGVIPLIPGARKEYDLVEARAILQRYSIEAAGELFVTVEKSQPLPAKMGGIWANFGRGQARGWEWLLVGLGIPYQLVGPKTWQPAMLEGTGGTTKERAILVAHRLFPLTSLRPTVKARTDSDGLADALLIGEWGRRQREGVKTAVAAAAAPARKPRRSRGASDRPGQGSDTHHT